MKWKLNYLLLLLITQFLIFPINCTKPTNVSPTPVTDFANVLDVVEHSVVRIDTSTGSAQGAGTGWVYNANGIIVTCNHVIAGATTIIVTFIDGKTYNMQSVKGDETTDIAVIKINAEQLPVLQLVDVSTLRVGDWALAIGNPLGQGISASEGIISRLGVSVPISATQFYDNVIETSAAINPGNSGGPLINELGQVMGVVSLKISQAGIEGMGYAYNIRDLLPVIQNLAK